MLREPIQFVIAAVKDTFFSNATCDHIEWGNKIVWHTSLKEAQKVSSRSKKPVMVVIYHADCPSCLYLIPRLAEDEDIVDLARHFTVLALQESDAPENMKKDGNYTPRIFFLTPAGIVQEKYFNHDGNPKFKHYFPNGKSLSKVMMDVLKEQGQCQGNRPCDLHGKQDGAM